MPYSPFDAVDPMRLTDPVMLFMGVLLNLPLYELRAGRIPGRLKLVDRDDQQLQGVALACPGDAVCLVHFVGS